MWDPAQYERFAAERARPFFDLVARIDCPHARRVVDLGCGPGTLTRTLHERWPAALVEGVDSSPQMLTRARQLTRPGHLEFCELDLRAWAPPEPVDVVVSNAALQWVPGHLELLAQLAGHLAAGGVLALQVPGNLDSPSHTLLRDLRLSPRWRGLVGEGADRGGAVHRPDEYLAELSGLGLETEVWETTYLHLLEGEDAVLAWVRGTALRPVLARLSEEQADRFVGEYAEALRAAYPPSPHGTVFPFRRIFAVARRPGPAAAPAAVIGLDHVQVAAPPGAEPAARAFYAGLLGLAEQPKPATLAGRGGCWFAGHDAQVHLGIEPEFRAARKAHVALRVDDLDGLAARLRAAGSPVQWDAALAPQRRFYTEDPFGNRLELLEPAPQDRSPRRRGERPSRLAGG